MNGTQLSQLFDCTTAYISQLVTAGMPKEPDGSYDINKVVPWYVNQLKGAKKTNEAQARARKLEAEAQLKELELRERSENLINVEDAVLEVGEIFSAIRSQMVALPSKVAPQLITCQTAGEAEGMLQKYVYQTLEELSTLPERLESLQDENRDTQLQQQSTPATQTTTNPS